LAALSVLGGVINLPSALGGGHWLANFLSPIFTYTNSRIPEVHLDHNTEYVLMGVSAIAAVIMAILAYQKYVKKSDVPQEDGVEQGTLYKLSYNKLYIDELYNTLFVKPLNA